MVGKYCLFISKSKEGEGNKSAYNLLTIQFLSKCPHTYDMRNNLIIVKKKPGRIYTYHVFRVN